MKRIAITIAALTFSTGAFAISNIDSDQNYGSVLVERTHPDSNVVQKINTHQTKYFLGGNSSSYGSVLADLDAPERDKARANTSERGLDAEISVGHGLFLDSNDNQF
jgi:hypothetical protein